jgi:alanyl-tRNA synthetase
MALRTAPSIEGSLRVVDIVDYDSSACCGTHVRATGEIGLIKVVRFEKYKSGSRVTFLCGHRALSAFQAKTEVMETVTRRMTLGEARLADGIDRLLDDRKRQEKTLRALKPVAAYPNP